MAAKKKYPDGTKRVSFFCPPADKAALVKAAEITDRTETEVLQDALRKEAAACGVQVATPPEAFG
ncbi:hypothetical protein PhaeoP66_03234 [Phaeobacter inhibens]|uniref:CopG family transcriptional regulator n=1 Tax=Phaeobacter inhibens TaxID=221822 RepID=A0ABN5GT84_9RHOB|nr:hypothetical protein [Phaeobacter inhibens]AUQ95976.1 hypothetical protein PhaeoP66_03234 [Phaeobacter inhibens]